MDSQRLIEIVRVVQSNFARNFTIGKTLMENSTGEFDATNTMHLSLVCPRMGGGGSGNPGELDFVKCTWVGILTSTMIPGVGNLTRPPS